MRGRNTFCMNTNHNNGKLNMFWILLDNQSTVHVFCNTMFLVNVRKTSKTLELHTNTGSATINEIGELPGVGTVWVYRNGIANILSFHKLQESNKFVIDYSSRPNKQGTVDRSFNVETPEGIRKKFTPDKKGLYVLDCSDHFGPSKDSHIFGKKVINTEHVLIQRKHGDNFTSSTSYDIQTSEGIKENFAQRDVIKAENVRRFQHIAGHASDETLIHMATKNTIKNVPFTPKDVRLARKILGKSVYALKGKRTSRQPTTVDTPYIVPLPKTIQENYNEITLAADVFHVNRMPFIGTISRNIHYSTASALPSMKLDDLQQAITGVIKSYSIRGFTVTHILVDIQFEGLEERMADTVKINTVSKQEHVPEMERFIRVIKERSRSYFAMLPFTKIPKIMLSHLIYTVIFYLNAFPWPAGVSQELSPCTIVEGITLTYAKHFQVIFGEYAQTYEGTDNTMKERTIGAIALGPSGNLQGGVRFFSLDTGRVINRKKEDYELIPMPADVIKRVNRMARKSRSGITFGDRTNNDDENEEDDPEDEEYNPTTVNTDVNVDPEVPDTVEEGIDDDTESHQTDHDQMIENTGVNNDNESISSNDDQDPHQTDEESADDEPEDQTNIPIDEEQSEPEGQPQESDDDSHSDSSDTDQDDNDPIVQPDVHTEQPQEQESYTTRSGRMPTSTQHEDFVYVQNNSVRKVETDQFPSKIRKLSANEQENYIKSLNFLNDCQRTDNSIYAHVMTQMNVARGIREYGEAGKASAMKEINNLVSRDCFGEIEYESLSDQQKRNALPILMFMVMKRNKTLKTRGCADGRKQRVWTNPIDVSSPTPANECLRYVLATAALETRDVATYDLPAQFLQTEMKGFLLLKLTGVVALLLVESDSKRWKPHLRTERGRKVIYVRCKKAIYGTLNAAILAYTKLTNNLTEWGFTMNPYDACVWNKTIDGEQMTVLFHVDDGLVTHVDPGRVTEFIKQLQDIYGKTDPLTITRGKKHEYLGMSIDFSTPGQVMISMYDYVQKLINKLPNDMVGNKPTAAPEYLFKTDGVDSTLLLKSQAEEYHTLTATTLYLSQKTRIDLQLAISFLCTRVKYPDQHDWKKLTHLMKYLQGSAFLPLILKSDGKATRIYIDGSHAIHADMRGHIGVYATEGKGAMYASANRMKLNTTSSTESEVVAVGEKLPKCLWYRMFRIAQGGAGEEDVLMQDNQSAMLLQNNGRKSVGKGSRHIDIRYFFITDRIQKQHIKVQYCPTEEMIADFFTKPLQGGLFHKFRDAILGIDAKDYDEYKKHFIEILTKYDLLNSHTFRKSQECVERTTDRPIVNGQARNSNQVIQDWTNQDTGKEEYTTAAESRESDQMAIQNGPSAKAHTSLFYQNQKPLP